VIITAASLNTILCYEFTFDSNKTLFANPESTFENETDEDDAADALQSMGDLAHKHQAGRLASFMIIE
jgi:hypothetical protein